jgi:hypothetical protein
MTGRLLARWAVSLALASLAMGLALVHAARAEPPAAPATAVHRI